MEIPSNMVWMTVVSEMVVTGWDDATIWAARLPRAKLWYHNGFSNTDTGVNLSNYKDVRIVTKLRQPRNFFIDQHISYREAVNAITNTLSKIALAIFSNQMNQKGLPCCHDFLIVTPICHSKLTHISRLHGEKIAEAIAFLASLFRKNVYYLISKV